MTFTPHRLTPEERAKLERLNALSPHARPQRHARLNVPRLAAWVSFFAVSYFTAQALVAGLWGAAFVFGVFVTALGVYLAPRCYPRSRNGCGRP